MGCCHPQDTAADTWIGVIIGRCHFQDTGVDTINSRVVEQYELWWCWGKIAVGGTRHVL